MALYHYGMIADLGRYGFNRMPNGAYFKATHDFSTTWLVEKHPNSDSVAIRTTTVLDDSGISEVSVVDVTTDVLETVLNFAFCDSSDSY
jgi:hypothetical protein